MKKKPQAALSHESPTSRTSELAASPSSNGHAPGANGSARGHWTSLHNEQDRLAAALDAARLGVWEWDIASGVVSWSPGLEAIHGREPGSFGGTVEDVLADVHPDDLARVQESIGRALETGARHHVEYRIRTASGDERWLEAHGTVEPGADGRPVRMIGVCMDVTARKLAERANADARRRERELTSALPAAIYTCDAQGRVTQFNDAAVELWGRTPTIGKDLWCGSLVIYRPDGELLPLEQCPMAIALRENRAVRGVEIVVERPDGTRRNVLPHPTPLRDDEGRLVGAINMLVDITERKKAEDQIRRSERELADFFDNASIGLHWVGPDGKVLRVNQAELDLLGYTREEYVGRHIADFHADKDVIDDILARLGRGESLHEYPARLRCKDGSIRHVLINSSVYFDNGKFIHTRCFTHDVTERRRAEAALRDADDRLKSILALQPAGVYACDASGRVTFYNRRAAELWGYEPDLSRQTINHCGFPRLFRADGSDLPHDQTPMADAVRNGRSYRDTEVVVERANGSRLTLSVNIDPIRDEHGRVTGAINVFTDVSARRAAELAHREADRERRDAAALLEGSLDALTKHIAILDGNGVILRVNAAWRRFAEENGFTDHAFGVGSNYLVAARHHGQGDSECAADAQEAARGIRAVIDGKSSSYTMEYPCHSPTERRWFTMRVNRFGEGDQVRVVVSHEDVTERREAEDARAQTAARLGVAIDATNLGTWDYDPIAQRAHWDDRCKELFGYVGNGDIDYYRDFLQILHPDDRARTDEAVRRALDPEGDGVYAVEYRAIGRADGVERWLKVNGQTTFEDGRAVRMIGSVLDITESKRAQAELAAARDDLAEQVAVLTRLHELTVRLANSPDLDESLLAIVEALVELHGANSGSLSLYDEDTGRLEHGASVGFPDGLLTSVGGVEPGPEAGACGACFARRERVFVEDTETDPRFAAYRDFARAAGFRSVHSTPIFTRTGTILGVLSIQHREPGRPSDRAVQIADLCARHAADTIESARSQRAVRESEQRYRSLTQIITSIVWTTDDEGRFVAPQESWADYTGQTFEELRGFGWADALHPDDRERVRAVWAKACATKSLYATEGRLWHAASKAYRHFEVRGVPIIDSEGDVREWVGTCIDVEDRKQFEHALRESEQRFRTMADTAPAMLWITDPSGSCTFLSRGWYEFTGQTEETGLGFGWLSAVYEPDRPRIAAHFRDASQRRKPFSFDYRFRRPDGEIRWLSDSGRPRFGVNGEFLGYIGSVIDVTERKRIEDALRESEAKFRNLADTMSQFAWIADETGWIHWYNKRWFEFTGTTLDEMKGWGWTKVHHPDHVQRVADHFARHIQSGEPWEDIFPLRGCDGRYRWFLSRALPIRDESGRITQWFGTNTDITEQREAEQTLRESEQRFRVMADQAPMLVWMADLSRGCNFFNKSWLEFTGRPMDHLLGDGWLQDVHSDDRARRLAAFLTAFDRREPFEVEYRLRRRDGEHRWVVDRAQPMLSPEGHFVGYVGSCVDITEQVLARQALERQQAALESAVRERTAELEESNARLRLAERMAALGTLSAGLGHDMGNLLVPVRVRLESLSKSDLSNDQLEDVEAIRTSAEYLRRLASGLRMLALDPEQAVAGETTPLLAWWSEAEPMLKNVLPRAISIESRFPDTECRVAISRAALTQVIFNLVQNAGDALRSRGSGALTIEATLDDDAVRLSVSDDGPGMTPEVRARCMEPFYTTKPRGISTGLGLALVYGLVREAGGAVELRSEPGVGTTFTLTIPRVPDESGAAAGPRRSALVRVRDARLRALVTSELRALSFDVRESAEAPDLIINDEPTVPAKAGAVIALVDQGVPAPDGVVVIGRRPTPRRIREAVRTAMEGR